MIYDNQKATATKISYAFLAAYRYALLRANEQSGKTGTYHWLIQLMFTLNLIDQVYILCGSNDTELLSQCNKDKEVHDEETRKKIKVLFRQDFERTKKGKKVPFQMITTRTLIIIDESHLVQGRNQTLAKFLKRHKLSMAGTTPDMFANNTYMLSVDATPYAEESAIAMSTCKDKFKITLPDGPGYFGIKQYFNAGLIRPTFDLVTGKSEFLALLENSPKKYIIVRTDEKNKSKELIRQYAESVGCDIKYFNSKYSGLATQICINREGTCMCLEDAPERTTIVFIDGRLRCGKRVPKKHVAFIWEGSKFAHTDVIRQSLPGRMSGYLATGDCDDECNCVGTCVYKVPEVKPLIFVPPCILKKDVKKVVPLSDLERTFEENVSKYTELTPRNATNLIPGDVQSIPFRMKCDCDECVYNRAHRIECHPPFIVTQCVPIRFQLDQVNSLHNSSEYEIKTYCLNRLMDEDENTLREIRTSRLLTRGQKDEILGKLNNLTVEQCSYRAYKETVNQSQHKSHLEAYKNNSAATQHIKLAPFLTFCVVHPGFVPMEGVTCTPGEVYAIFYTEAQGHDKHINFESRVSKVNAKTHFTRRIEGDFADSVAGSMFGFSPKILLDSNELLREFDHFIEFTQKGIGLFDRKFTALGNGEYIQLPHSVYGNNRQELMRIFSELERKHSVKITVNFKRFQPVLSENDLKNYHEIKSITW